MRRETVIDVFILLIFSSLILLFGLGYVALLDPDEPVYAQTAREMIVFGDYFSPRIYGEFWFDKPPMYYWLVSASFHVFGQTEFAARFPASVMAILTVLLIYISGKEIFSRRVGIISAFVFVTSIFCLYIGRAAVTDTTLTFFLSLCLFSFVRKQYYLFYIAMGFAVLTKGPVGIVFGAGFSFLWFILRGEYKNGFFKPLKGWYLALLVPAPWYVGMYQLHGFEFIETFLGFHNITRFLEPEHKDLNVWYYYFPVLFVGFFPWIAVLLQSVFNAIVNRDRNSSAPLFLLIWAFCVFVFFSISKTKLVSYIYPMIPAVSMLVGYYFDCKLQERSGFKKDAFIMSILMVVFVVALDFFGVRDFPEVSSALIAITAIFLLMLLLLWWALKRRQFNVALMSVVVGMTLFSVVLVSMIFVPIESKFTVNAVKDEVKAHYTDGMSIYVNKFYRPGFAWYIQLPSREYLKEANFADVVQGEKNQSLLVLSDKQFAKIPNQFKGYIVVVKTLEDKVVAIYNPPSGGL